jgi:hypothetical protein
MQPTVQCSCPFLTPFLLGIGVAVLGAVALDKALPTEAELAREEADRRYRRESLALAKSGSYRRPTPPRVANGVTPMRLGDRMAASGW